MAEKTVKPVRIYSQTYFAHQLTIRLLSMLTGIPISSIETRELDKEQGIQLATATNWLVLQDIYDMVSMCYSSNLKKDVTIMHCQHISL